MQTGRFIVKAFSYISNDHIYNITYFLIFAIYVVTNVKVAVTCIDPFSVRILMEEDNHICLFWEETGPFQTNCVPSS